MTNKSLKSLRIFAVALSLATTLAGACATPSMAVPASYSRNVVLPDTHEFREGDVWEAYDTETSARFNTNAYNLYQLHADRWLPANLGADNNPRAFKDLAGKEPDFPKNWKGAWAAPDGHIYVQTNKPGEWMLLRVGLTVSGQGRKFDITERMTAAQAQQLTQFVYETTLPNVSVSMNAPSHPTYVNHAVHCPNGYAFPQDIGKPAGWQPPMMNMIGACAVVAGLH